MLRIAASVAITLFALAAVNTSANAFCERECVTICRKVAVHVQGCVRDRCPAHRGDKCEGARAVNAYVRKYRAEHGTRAQRRHSACSGGYSGCLSYSRSLGWSVGAASAYCGQHCAN